MALGRAISVCQSVHKIVQTIISQLFWWLFDIHGPQRMKPAESQEEREREKEIWMGARDPEWSESRWFLNNLSLCQNDRWRHLNLASISPDGSAVMDDACQWIGFTSCNTRWFRRRKNGAKTPSRIIKHSVRSQKFAFSCQCFQCIIFHFTPHFLSRWTGTVNINDSYQQRKNMHYYRNFNISMSLQKEKCVCGLQHV